MKHVNGGWNKMKRQALRWIALVLALVMSLSLAACSSKQDTAANDTTGTPAADTAADTQTPSASDDGTNVIKIGLMLQLSGSSPADSEELLKGCQKIADIINNETDYNLPLAATAGLPNLNGAKIEIVVGDAATNDAAMSECQRLITEEGVAGFAGILGSSGVKVCATAFEKYGIPYVTNASSPSLTTSGYEYLVRIFPDDSLYCRSMFEMIDEMNKEQDAGIKTIALCSKNNRKPFFLLQPLILKRYAVLLKRHCRRTVSHAPELLHCPFRPVPCIHNRPRDLKNGSHTDTYRPPV